MNKVCIVRQKHYPAQRNLRRNAETLVKAGYEVDVVCVGRKGQKKRETMNGVNLHRVIMSYHRGKVFWYIFEYAAFFIQSSLKLAWLSIKKRYDVIEVHTMPDFLVFVTLFPKLLGSKVVLFMFENTPSLFMSSYNASPSHIVARLLRFIEKISASYADYVFVSDGLPYKKALEKHGIRSEKITVILNVPDDTIINSELVPTTNNGNCFRLIVVSVIVERSGIQTLINAIPLLRDDIPMLKVDIVGEGEYHPYLERIAEDLKVKQFLNFTGWVPYEEVPSYIMQADVGVAPMIHDVGAPNKIFEYFALDKPAIASAHPGVTEVFDNDCVLYFQPGNERELASRILELYYNPQKRASLVSHAQAVYCKCRWPVTKQKYLETYRELLAR